MFAMPTLAMFAMPTLAKPPTTMLASRVANFTACTRPQFSCIETVRVRVPTPLPLEALVKVNVSSVNPSDVDIVEDRVVGKLFGTLGVDFSGEVVATGPLCSLKVGDKVWGATIGAYAEYAIVICAITGKLSDDVDPRAVGTLAEVGMTSAEALQRTGAPWEPTKNLTVVITSGSGGTGFVAIQLAKSYGAGKVVTATSGASNTAFVKSIGADVVVDYKVSDIFAPLANNSVDVVYDNYGAKGTADRAMAKLKPGGTFIFLPGKGGELSKHPKPGVRQMNYGLMVPKASVLDELLDLYRRGALKPHVQATFPLTNVSGAFAQSAQGHVVGKLAIAM